MRNAIRNHRDGIRLGANYASVRADALDAPILAMDLGGPIGSCDAKLDALPVGIGGGFTAEHGGSGVHGGGGLGSHLSVVASFHDVVLSLMRD